MTFSVEYPRDDAAAEANAKYAIVCRGCGGLGTLLVTIDDSRWSENTAGEGHHAVFACPKCGPHQDVYVSL